MKEIRKGCSFSSVSCTASWNTLFCCLILTLHAVSCSDGYTIVFSKVEVFILYIVVVSCIGEHGSSRESLANLLDEGLGTSLDGTDEISTSIHPTLGRNDSGKNKTSTIIFYCKTTAASDYYIH